MLNLYLNTEYKNRRQTKQRHNTISVEHHYTQTNTNNVSKTWNLLHTTGGKDETNNNIGDVINNESFVLKCISMFI